MHQAMQPVGLLTWMFPECPGLRDYDIAGQPPASFSACATSLRASRFPLDVHVLLCHVETVAIIEAVFCGPSAIL